MVNLGKIGGGRRVLKDSGTRELLVFSPKTKRHPKIGILPTSGDNSTRMNKFVWFTFTAGRCLEKFYTKG